jgi:asparagine synthase (glutamine-hydrolysing)
LAGSEIKQFTVTGEFEAKMFHPVAYEFLEHGVLNHNEYSFFENVYVLLAGHNLIYDLKDHSYSIYRWYFLEKETGQKRLDSETAARQFRENFENAVRIHLRSDVKLGSCLSGGLDSSAIVSMSRKILGNEIPIYTVTSCNADGRYDESEYAKAVVEHCRTEEVITYPDLNALYTENLLEKIAWYHDQPIPSGSHFSEYAVFEAARKNHLTVMLDGQGSDEYMAGYHEFFMMRCKGLLKKGRFKTLHRTIVERSRNRGIPVKSLYTTLLKMVIQRSRQGNVSAWFSEEWVGHQRKSKAATHIGGMGNAGDLYSLSLLEIQKTSIPYQLHSEDRNAMLFSIESRVPFLDHILVQSMLNLPEDVYYRYALDKAPLREGLKDILPEKIYQRRTKLGFVSSDEVWMQEHGQEVRERLAAAVNDFGGIIKASVLDEFDRYVAGKRNYDGIFFRILSLHAWYRATKVKLC